MTVDIYVETPNHDTIQSKSHTHKNLTVNFYVEILESLSYMVRDPKLA
jgi:hypothetical protein